MINERNDDGEGDGEYHSFICEQCSGHNAEDLHGGDALLCLECGAIEYTAGF